MCAKMRDFAATRPRIVRAQFRVSNRIVLLLVTSSLFHVRITVSGAERPNGDRLGVNFVGSAFNIALLLFRSVENQCRSWYIHKAYQIILLRGTWHRLDNGPSARQARRGAVSIDRWYPRPRDPWNERPIGDAFHASARNLKNTPKTN